MTKPKIAIILSTTRAARFGHKAGQWLFDIAKQRSDMDFELVDLRDHPLPFFDEIELHVASLLGDVEKPLPGFMAKAGGAGRRKDDGDLRLGHGSGPFKSSMIHMTHVRNDLSHRNMEAIIHHDNRQNCGSYHRNC